MSSSGYEVCSAASSYDISIDNDPFTSKIGGYPILFPKLSTDDKLINFPLSSLICNNCSIQLTLIVQLYTPNLVDRCIYLFGCKNDKCLKGWKAYSYSCAKIIEDDDEFVQEKKEIDWGVAGSDDWGDETEELPIIPVKNEKVLESSTLIKTELVYEEPEVIKLQDCVSPRILNWQNEPALNYSHELKLLQAYRAAENDDTTSEISNDNNDNIDDEKENEDADGSETDTEEELSDFLDRMSRLSSFSLLYKFDGIPCISEKLPKIEPCSCGSKRVFEFQLLPSIDQYLKIKSPYTCVYVFACPKEL